MGICCPDCQKKLENAQSMAMFVTECWRDVMQQMSEMKKKELDMFDEIALLRAQLPSGKSKE